MPLSKIGHNGGPALNAPQPTRDEVIQRLRAEIAHLEDLAAGRAQQQVVAACKRVGGDWSMSTRFAPSRLAKCPRDRRFMADQLAGAMAAARAPYEPQINRLRRKLARLTGELP